MTATNVLKGLDQSRSAIDLIEKGEYKKAMNLLRQSYNNCDKVSFFYPDKIISALYKCDSRNPDVMFVKALLCNNHNLNDKIRFTKECIRNHPNEADFYLLLSCFYGFSCDYDKGLEAINTALKLNDSDPRLIYLKASLMLNDYRVNDKLRDPSILNQTFDLFQEYLEKNPIDDKKMPEAYYSMAYLASLKNDVDACRSYWNKAQELDTKTRLPCFDPVDENNLFKCMSRMFLISMSTSLCGKCGKDNPRFKCSCLQEAYCSRECQVAHWPTHKLVCWLK